MISIGTGTFMVILAVVGAVAVGIGRKLAGDDDTSLWMLLAIIGGVLAAVGLLGMIVYSVTADFALARIDELMRQFPFLRRGG